MEIQQQNLFTRLIVSMLFIAVMAGSWDVWWHGAVGRDTFWEPPHILLYSAVIVAISAGAYVWYKTREKIWRWLAVILAFIPISAPFDELWHRAFGVENLSSPLILWSTPHLILIGAMAAGFTGLLPLIRKDPDVTAQRFFGSLAIAAILQLLLLVASPLEPTGPWGLIGFWGAGVLAAIIVVSLLFASDWMPGIAGAVVVTAFFLVVSSIGFTGETAPEVSIQPHDHPPGWLTVFSFTAAALAVDLLKRKPRLITGAIAAILWGGLLYGFSSMFFEPEFQYSSNDAAIAILASAAGGIIGGIIAAKVILLGKS